MKLLKTYISKKMWVLSFFLITLNSYTQEQIIIDFNDIVKKNINPGSASANLCWLLDSDKNNKNPQASMEHALKELSVGSLRFPYGHLGDNYLWHTAPFNQTNKGLRPKVASMSQAPGRWDWAVRGSGSFKNAMDFDEYMALCKKLDIKPLVVVNVLSHKYKNGPSLDELIETAVEWVKYANKMNYHVEYWQIGNEVDHHKKLLSPEEYINCYQKFAKAMKAVDSTIKVGPGILQNVKYFKDIVKTYPDLIDFTSCHQYMWKYLETCKTYDLWKEHKSNYIPNVVKMQKAVRNSAKPNMEIVITETGVAPAGKGMGNVNNVNKALWYFEVLMNEISQPNVAYSYFWGTHSPWDGNKDNDTNDVAVLLRIDDNSRKPIAEVVKLVNEEVLDNIVKTKKITGTIRTFASMNNEGKCNVFLMNKDTKAKVVNIALNQLPEGIKSFSRNEVIGKNPEDRKLEFTNSENVNVQGNTIELTLQPLSITVLNSI